jgi:hypothetical protein
LGTGPNSWSVCGSGGGGGGASLGIRADLFGIEVLTVDLETGMSRSIMSLD